MIDLSQYIAYQKIDLDMGIYQTSSLGGSTMTIVAATTIHPNAGIKWEDVQKRIKKACDLACKHGAENVTVPVTMTGAPATNTIGVLSSAEDRVRYM
jgi:hypothetical protein